MESWYLWLIILFLMISISPSVMGGILFALIGTLILIFFLVVKGGPMLVEMFKGLDNETKQKIVKFLDDLKKSNDE